MVLSKNCFCGLDATYILADHEVQEDCRLRSDVHFDHACSDLMKPQIKLFPAVFQLAYDLQLLNLLRIVRDRLVHIVLAHVAFNHRSHGWCSWHLLTCVLKGSKVMLVSRFRLLVHVLETRLWYFSEDVAKGLAMTKLGNMILTFPYLGRGWHPSLAYQKASQM